MGGSRVMSDLERTSSARLKVKTIKALKALRRYSEFDETIDDVCQRLITFYLAKPKESRKVSRRKDD